MRRLVVALILAALVVTLAGCGGGGDEAAQQPAEDAAAGGEAAPPPAPAADAAETQDFSAQPTTYTWEPFPKERGALPDAIESRLEAEQPMLLFFFDPDQDPTKDQRKQIDAVMDDYRGTIDLVSYDVSRALEKGAAENTQVAEASTLTGLLGVDYTPYTMVVDDEGYIIWRARGVVDKKLIEQAVLTATE